MLAGRRVLQKEQSLFSRSLEVGILSLQNTSSSYSCVREVYMKHTKFEIISVTNLIFRVFSVTLMCQLPMC